MTGWHLERPVGLSRPCAHNILAHTCALLLLARSVDSPAARTSKWVWVARPASAEWKQIGTAIWRMHDGAPVRKARPGVSPGASTQQVPVHARCRRQAWCLSLPSWRTRHPDSCMAQPNTSPLCGRMVSTGGQIQPSSQRAAAPLAGPWFWDDGRDPPRWCPETRSMTRLDATCSRVWCECWLHQRDLR
jgi:hypothetical protein